MYKCSYCDTVFMEYHNNCPNCGGSCWLTPTTQNKDTSTDTKVEDVTETGERVTETSTFGCEIITILFTFVIIVAAIYAAVTCDAYRYIIEDVLGI